MTADKLLLVTIVFALLRGTFAFAVVVRYVPPRHRIHNTILGLVVTTAPHTLTAHGDSSGGRDRSQVHHGGRHD